MEVFCMSDEIFGALANRYRREIVQLLRKKDMSAGEIVENFDIAQPSISRHLDVLKKADIIRSVRVGNQIIYSLNGKIIEDLMIFCAKLLPMV